MIGNKHIHHVQEVLSITAIWIMATILYVFIKFSDIPESELSSIYSSNVPMSKEWLYRSSLCAAIPLGLALGMLHTYVYPHMTRNRGLLFNAGIRSLVFSGLSLAVIFMLSFYSMPSEMNVPTLKEVMSSSAILSIFIYMMVTDNLVTLFIMLRRNLGSSFFRNTVINTYRNPKEEQRVFMFLDMENSTPTAHRMGHLNFSRYIQDCFFDLSGIVIDHNGEIYQFVGDEAVITWRIRGRFDYEKCAGLYFAFMDHLARREEHYVKKYDAKPVFRCSLHMGNVSTAIVGDYKKEIAFHGDVLNYCARLQSVCKQSDAYMLVSGTFLEKLMSTGATYTSHEVLLHDLKGIGSGQVAYKINRKH